MQNCFQIRKSDDLVDYLQTFGKKQPFHDFDYQLQTNYGYVYNLKNGEVVFIPNNFRNDGLFFDSKKCFKQIIDDDRFPIENPERNLYDTEIDRIKTINQQIDFYHGHSIRC